MNGVQHSLLQGDTIIFDRVSLACPKYWGKFLVSLWHLKKEVTSEVRNLTALAGSNTTLMIYCTFNVSLPMILFLSQYGIHTKPLLYLINCLCSISSLLLFQVMVGPCKLAGWIDFLLNIQLFGHLYCLWPNFPKSRLFLHNAPIFFWALHQMLAIFDLLIDRTFNLFHLNLLQLSEAILACSTVFQKLINLIY